MVIHTQSNLVVLFHLPLEQGQMQLYVLEDIAKYYGVSRERIRQIQTKAMRKLRQAMGKQYGENFFIPMRQF